MTAWKKNRNSHARILLQQLQHGKLEQPFTAGPPLGPLSMLPPWLLAQLRHSSGRLQAGTRQPAGYQGNRVAARKCRRRSSFRPAKGGNHCGSSKEGTVFYEPTHKAKTGSPPATTQSVQSSSALSPVQSRWPAGCLELGNNGRWSGMSVHQHGQLARPEHQQV